MSKASGGTGGESGESGSGGAAGSAGGEAGSGGTTGGTSGGGGDAGTGGSGGSESGGSGGADAAGGSAGSGSSGGSLGGSSGTGGAPSCIAATLVDLVTGSTQTEDDDFSPSCAAGSSADVAFSFTAPATDYYRFDTTGTAFDAVVALYDDCDGAELACGNDGGGSRAELAARVEKDQTVTVVLDGNVGARGDFSLSVAPVTCPNIDLTGQPVPATLTTEGQPDSFVPTCPQSLTPGGSDRAVRWVADADGMYRFLAQSSNFSPTLSVFRGAECGGELVQCNDAVSGGHPATVTQFVNAGEALTLVVDSASGGGGEFTLDIQNVADACPMLPELNASLSNVTLDDATGTELLSTSCGWAGSAMGHYEEHIYSITLDPTQFLSACEFRVTADSVVYLSLIKGNACYGTEVECQSGTDVEVTVSRADAGDYMLVIENTNDFRGYVNYDLAMSCL